MPCAVVKSLTILDRRFGLRNTITSFDQSALFDYNEVSAQLCFHH